MLLKTEYKNHVQSENDIQKGFPARKLMNGNARIAIVNRGEPAMRFIKAVKEYNEIHSTELKTVVFYQTADLSTPWVMEADYSIEIEKDDLYQYLINKKIPYLDKEWIIKSLKKHQCDAVWAGWGFVSEDAHFVSLLESEQIVFLGPTSSAMKSLGDKILSKHFADEAKVPTTPWSKGALRDLDHALEVALKIGYPVILKSSAGGGGRGIQKIYKEDDLRSSFYTMKSISKNAFGDDTLFMEALVQNARHIEVQCIADYHGNVRTFGVRDCSVQRNNQKIIEETPPVGYSEAEMQLIEEKSAELLRLVGYHGAGTVEFLYDLDRKSPVFMEVNTRLQVEHCITEMLFNIDLVQMQIHVALGGEIGSVEKKARGHVIEVRLNAEDPYRGFAPSPGYVKKFIPSLIRGIRTDSGVTTGSEISPNFDSMIAKIIAVGDTRELTMKKLKLALLDTHIDIEGGATNLPFLLELLSLPQVTQNFVKTDFVEKYIKEKEALEKAGQEKSSTKWEGAALIMTAIYLYGEKKRAALNSFESKIYNVSDPQEINSIVNGFKIPYKSESHNIIVHQIRPNQYIVSYDKDEVVVTKDLLDQKTYLTIDGEKIRIHYARQGDALSIDVGGEHYSILLGDSGEVKTLSPSVLIIMNAKEGDLVRKGDWLFSLEAMKMEQKYFAEKEGVIKKISASVGQQLKAGSVVLEIEKVSQNNKDITNTTQQKMNKISFKKQASDAPQEKNDLEIKLLKIKALFCGRISEGLHKSDRSDLLKSLNEEKHSIVRCIELLGYVKNFILVNRVFSNNNFHLNNSQHYSWLTIFQHLLVFRDDLSKYSKTFQETLKTLHEFIHGKELLNNSSRKELIATAFHLYQIKNNQNMIIDHVIDFILHAMEHADHSEVSKIMSEIYEASLGQTIINNKLSKALSLVSMKKRGF